MDWIWIQSFQDIVFLLQHCEHPPSVYGTKLAMGVVASFWQIIYKYETEAADQTKEMEYFLHICPGSIPRRATSIPT